MDTDRLRNDPCYYSMHPDHHSYLARGRYAEHLRPWVEQLPGDQLLVLRAEDLFRQAAETFDTVQNFLRLPVRGQVQLSTYNSRTPPPISADTKARLAAYYRPHNAALYELLGRDLDWERSYPTD